MNYIDILRYLLSNMENKPYQIIYNFSDTAHIILSSTTHIALRIKYSLCSNDPNKDYLIVEIYHKENGCLYHKEEIFKDLGIDLTAPEGSEQDKLNKSKMSVLIDNLRTLWG